MIKEIKDNKLPELKASQTAIIEFGADWCPPCKIQRPVLEQIEKDQKLGTEVFTIDVDDNPELAEELNIMSIPTIFVIKNGQLNKRIVGYLPYDQLVSYIK